MFDFKQKLMSNFKFEGQFLGFDLSDGYKLKSMKLLTAEGEYKIKIPKDWRPELNRTLMHGDWLRVQGEKKLDLDTGVLKLKASHLVKLTDIVSLPVASPQNVSTSVSSPAKVQILICQKSDCVDKGSNQICKVLKSALADRDLSNRVNIKSSGCLKCCKQGPNLVLMPSKSRYSNVNINQIPALMDTINSVLQAQQLTN
jgi:(2Fe-2S) ferredoxin